MAQTLSAPTLSLPCLESDSAESSPIELDELVRYLRTHVDGATVLTPRELAFVRTARVEGCAYWVWRFEVGTNEVFALVMRDPAGDAWMSCHVNDANLSAEQMLLADYRMALQDS